MFYDNSEPDFPNWWDFLDGGEQGTEGGEGARDGDGLSSGDGDGGGDRSTGDVGRGGEESEWGDRRGGDANRHEGDVDRRGGDSVSEGDSLPYAADAARGSYDREVVRRVWEFAEIVPGNDADLWRKDEFGNWIYRLDYGRRESEFGWEVFDPGVGRHAQGVYAMRPMQWESFVGQYRVLG